MTRGKLSRSSDTCRPIRSGRVVTGRSSHRLSCISPFGMLHSTYAGCGYLAAVSNARLVRCHSSHLSSFPRGSVHPSSLRCLIQPALAHPGWFTRFSDSCGRLASISPIQRRAQYADNSDLSDLDGWLCCRNYLDIWNVGNAAHISGLLFGGIVAGHIRRPLQAASHVCWPGRDGRVLNHSFVLVSVSVTWLSNKAFNAHLARRYDVAVDRYTQIIRIDPDNAWAYLNRSYVYQALGQPEEARTDLEKALGIDPSIGKGQ